MKLKSGTGRHCMTRLTHTFSGTIHVVFSRYRSKLNSPFACPHIAFDQPDIGNAPVTCIHMGSVAIGTLYILAATVMGNFFRMAIRADV